jgi:hypothetical protein
MEYRVLLGSSGFFWRIREFQGWNGEDFGEATATKEQSRHKEIEWASQDPMILGGT